MEILSKFDGDKSPCPSNVPAPLLHQNENKIKNHKKIQHRKNRSRKKDIKFYLKMNKENKTKYKHEDEFDIDVELFEDV